MVGVVNHRTHSVKFKLTASITSEYSTPKSRRDLGEGARD